MSTLSNSFTNKQCNSKSSEFTIFLPSKILHKLQQLVCVTLKLMRTYGETYGQIYNILHLICGKTDTRKIYMVHLVAIYHRDHASFLKTVNKTRLNLTRILFSWILFMPLSVIIKKRNIITKHLRCELSLLLLYFHIYLTKISTHSSTS